MGCVVPLYRPRDAEHTVLHQVIGEHLEVFLGAAAEASDGAGLPPFVEREFREFLLCGVFEAGVPRFRCEGCWREPVVPFEAESGPPHPSPPPRSDRVTRDATEGVVASIPAPP